MQNNKPLNNVKVVDLTTYAAAPGAARIMADWGANVIKVEPHFGDNWRYFGSILGMPAKHDENPCWEIDNANKRGIALDLKSDKGLKILDELIAGADVFITNFRTKALAKLDLSYELLSKKYPRLVYAHLTGFGEKGPDVHKAGFDAVSFWARSGCMIDLSEKGHPPMTSPAAMGDHTSSLALTGGICAALYQQQATGKGEKVKVALYGAGIWFAGVMMMPTQERYGQEYPVSRKKPPSALVTPFKCRDGEWFMPCVFDYDRYWPDFCKAIDREDLIKDERYSTTQAAFKNSESLMVLLDEIFITKDRDEWIDLFIKADIAHDKLQHFKDVIVDEQAWANDFLYEYTYPNEEKGVLPAPPIQFEEMGRPDHKRAPLIGEHSREVLQEMGYSDEKINELAKDKVINKEYTPELLRKFGYSEEKIKEVLGK